MTNFSNISVIGCGRWGGFLGYYCAKYLKSNVLFLGVPQDPAYQSLVKTGNNGYCQMPKNVSLTTDMAECLKNDFIIVSIGCQAFRGLCRQMAQYDLKGKTFLLAMKGLEEKTSARMSQIFHQEIHEPTAQVACLMGPGHVQDYLKEIPSCVVIDSENQDTTQEIAQFMNSHLIRTYYGSDLIGNEFKNDFIRDSVVFEILEPATTTGSNIAIGVIAPVLPTWNIISFNNFLLL